MALSTFFSIDDILTEDQKVTAEFLTPGYNLDSLDTWCISFTANMPTVTASDRNENDMDDRRLNQNQLDDQNLLGKREICTTDVAKGTKVDIPWWLCVGLLKKRIVKTGIPKYYSDAFKQATLADPEITNLRDKSLYYYEFGIKLVQNLDCQNKIADLLCSIFFRRMKKL